MHICCRFVIGPSVDDRTPETFILAPIADNIELWHSYTIQIWGISWWISTEM